RSVANAAETVGRAVAAEAGLTPAVEDVAPASAGDPSGTVEFYAEVAAPRMTSPWLSWGFVVCGWFVLATAGGGGWWRRGVGMLGVGCRWAGQAWVRCCRCRRSGLGCG